MLTFYPFGPCFLEKGWLNLQVLRDGGNNTFPGKGLLNEKSGKVGWNVMTLTEVFNNLFIRPVREGLTFRQREQLPQQHAEAPHVRFVAEFTLQQKITLP